MSDDDDDDDLSEADKDFLRAANRSYIHVSTVLMKLCVQKQCDPMVILAALVSHAAMTAHHMSKADDDTDECRQAILEKFTHILYHGATPEEQP